MDGKTRVLTKGEDFTCSAKSMQNAISIRAYRVGVRIRTKIIDAEHVRMQALLL
jgi:hypothetical protein